MAALYTKLGVGVEWNAEGARLVALGRRLRQTEVLDWLHLEDPGAEDAPARVAEFLGRNRLREARVTAVLPREAVLVRFLDLPAEAERQLRQVINYQLDILHPYQGKEVYWDCAVVARDQQAKQVRVLVVLAEKSRVESYRQALGQLGLLVDSVTLGAACLTALVGPALPDAALVVCGRADSLELVGLGQGRLLATRELSAEPEETAADRLERELHGVRGAFPGVDAAALSQFVCGTLPAAFSDLLAEVSSLPDLSARLTIPHGFQGSAELPALAAAWTSLERKPIPGVNLLPREERVRPARWKRLPAYALGATAAALALLLVVHGPLETVLYARALDAQTARLEARATEAQQWRRQGSDLEERAALLEGVRQRTWEKLRLLQEVTRVLPDDTWLREVELSEETVELSGFSNRAAELAKLLEDSPYFAQVDFTAPITRSNDGKEIFRIRMRVESAKGQGQ